MHLRQQGKPVPKLDTTSVILYGKDGSYGKHEVTLLSGLFAVGNRWYHSADNLLCAIR